MIHLGTSFGRFLFVFLFVFFKKRIANFGKLCYNINVCKQNSRSAVEGRKIMRNEENSTERLLAFIQKSPTAFHAVQEIALRLEEQGFVRLEEGKTWTLFPGHSYYLTRNLSTLVAFRMPMRQPKQILLTATHTDSPLLKLKPNAESATPDHLVKLNTEVYGSTIFSSWFDRPLSIAGRVIVQENDRFTAKLVNFDRDLALIPSVAIHMNRNINSGYEYNAAIDLAPLFSQSGETGTLNRMICEELSCNETQIAGADLYLYNRTAGRVFGANNEFFAAPGIDDLMCAHGALCGFLQAEQSEDSLNVCFFADNEEVGSETKQGAASILLSDVFNRICESVGADLRQLLATSFMVSADNAHAQHPNHRELSDSDHAPHMNQGVVIKTNAAQKYATDGMSAALFAEICRRADVPVQYYANRSDMAGGSTLGSLSNARVPLCTVDIGMAQLAMHSSYETAGCADNDYLIRAIKQFYEIGLVSDRDGEFRLIFEKRGED